jgi:hypothetical protein
MMKTNESNLDRVARGVVGIGLFALYFTGIVNGIAGYILLAVGAILLITAAVGFCPLYALLKISTKRA